MSILETTIGWLAPPDCLSCGNEGDLLCVSCSQIFIKPFGERCWRCNKLSPNSKTCINCRQAGSLASVHITTSYESIAQLLVRSYKFGHSRLGAKPLAGLMAGTLRLQSYDGYSPIIIPVPTATSRMRERGFDHSLLLAKTIASKLRLEYSNNLRRLGQTRQLGSKREDRLKQLADSFVVKNYKTVNGRDVLLVDDVLTTGGTLIAAAKTLKQNGAKQVSALVFAKKL